VNRHGGRSRTPNCNLGTWNHVTLCCRDAVACSHSHLRAAYRLRASRARLRLSKSRSRQYRADASPPLRDKALNAVSEVKRGTHE